ncbi:hypothetical protein CALCODRAFT_423638, partial [Calocera cornea HHB12733]
SDVIMHCRRLRFSRAQQAAMLLWASAMGASPVPSLYGLGSWREKSLMDMGDPTRRFVSLHGNVYYLNSIAHSLAQDLANPLKRPSMEFYPIAGGPELLEFWHGTLCTVEVGDEVLTPMIEHDGRHWFTHELLQCRNGAYFIP